jgi:hypothetical protein
MSKKSPWLLCPVCNGEGTTVNPSVDCNGLSAEDFREDPDFAENYFNGAYDIVCQGCDGRRVITRECIKELARNAADRRLAAQEDGDWESYSGAGDWRFG